MPKFDLKVIARTDAGVCCGKPESPGETFWLSIRACQWSGDLKPGSSVRVEVPEWLVLKHRQLAGHEAFENAKQSNHGRRTTMAEQRELSGLLSRNTRRENDKQPEFRGSATIGGVAYRISGWVKEGTDGKSFSLAFSPKDAQPSVQAKTSAAAPAAAYKPKQIEDDGIPF
jgi:hypothetical protein